MLKGKQMVRIKHDMDTDYREATLDEAFEEALSLSVGGGGEQCSFEEKLLFSVQVNPQLLERIDSEYKLSIIRSWDYEVETLN